MSYYWDPTVCYTLVGPSEQMTPRWICQTHGQNKKCKIVLVLIYCLELTSEKKRRNCEACQNWINSKYILPMKTALVWRNAVKVEGPRPPPLSEIYGSHELIYFPFRSPHSLSLHIWHLQHGAVVEIVAALVSLINGNFHKQYLHFLEGGSLLLGIIERHGM